MTPCEAALSLYQVALMKALAMSPARRPHLWRRAEAARVLAERLGATTEEIASITLSALRVEHVSCR